MPPSIDDPKRVPTEAGWNRCPTDIIKLIIDLFAQPGHPRDTAQLKACALISRRWRYSAQRVLHRSVIVTPALCRDILRVYTRTSRSNSNKSSVAMDLSPFPRSLYISWMMQFPINFLTLSKEFKAFTKRCGKQIMELKVHRCDFRQCQEFFRLFEWFPSPINVQISDCMWDVNVPKSPLAVEFVNRGGVINVPPSLQAVTFSSATRNHLRYTYDPLAFATWISQSPHVDLPSLEILYPLNLTKIHFDLARVTLKSLGPRLRQIDITVSRYAPQHLSGEFLLTAYVDLSANSNLRNISIRPSGRDTLNQGDFFIATLTTITSPVLEEITLYLELFREDHTTLEFIHIDSIVQLLSNKAKFPSLKKLNIRIAFIWVIVVIEGKPLWELIHETVAPLRKRGVQVLYENVKRARHARDFYDSVAYENGVYDALEDDDVVPSMAR